MSLAVRSFGNPTTNQSSHNPWSSTNSATKAEKYSCGPYHTRKERSPRHSALFMSYSPDCKGGDDADIARLKEKDRGFLIDAMGHGKTAEPLRKEFAAQIRKILANEEMDFLEICQFMRYSFLSRLEKAHSEKWVATSFYEYNRAYGTLLLASFGMAPPLLYSSNGQRIIIDELPSDGIIPQESVNSPIASFFGTEDDFAIVRAYGLKDKLHDIILFSDGHPDCRNKEGETCGYEHFAELMSKFTAQYHSFEPLSCIARKIDQNYPHSTDDRTIFVAHISD